MVFVGFNYTNPYSTELESRKEGKYLSIDEEEVILCILFHFEKYKILKAIYLNI